MEGLRRYGIQTASKLVEIVTGAVQTGNFLHARRILDAAEQVQVTAEKVEIAKLQLKEAEAALQAAEALANCSGI